MENTFLKIVQTLSAGSYVGLNALAVLIIGLVCASWVKSGVIVLFSKIRFDRLLKRIGWDTYLTKLHASLDIIPFIGVLVQLFIIILFLMISTEIISLRILSQYLEKIILFYPNIFISIIIFIISVYAVDFAQKIVVGTQTAEKIKYSRFLGKSIDWTIRVIATLAILYQLQIVPQLILIVFIGFVLSISLAFGISLGLSGKEPMSKLLKQIEQSIH